MQVLEQEDLDRLGMRTLLAVSRGSEQPPKLIILRIPGQDKRHKTPPPLDALVGKGVTFDSGGISIKPADKMEEMKADMAGGAAVLGAMVALAQLRPRQRVIGIIPAVENLPSGRATRPGDVVKSLSGKTVEIINTDAEGRLVFAWSRRDLQVGRYKLGNVIPPASIVVDLPRGGRADFRLEVAPPAQLVVSEASS